MSRGWPRAAIQDLAETVAMGPFGSSIKVETFVSEGVPIISGQHLKGFTVDDSPGHNFITEEHALKLRKANVRPGDVILTHAGSIGQAAFIPETALYDRYVISQRQFFVRCDTTKMLPGFLTYYLHSPEGHHALMANAVQTGVPSIAQPVSYVRTIEVPVPPLEVQRGIVETLSALDHKIQSNRRTVTAALALARAHVDQATAGKPSCPYSDALAVFMGAAFKGDQFTEPGVGRPLLRIRDLKTFESQTWTTEARKDETIICPGDIVVGMDAEFRATLWLGGESLLNQRVCSFRGRACVSRAFVLAALEPELAFQERAKTGTTVIHLNKADIETFTVPALSTDEHERLFRVTEPLIDLAVGRAIETQRLAKTCDKLVPMLFSGRVRVPEARMEMA